MQPRVRGGLSLLYYTPRVREYAPLLICQSVHVEKELSWVQSYPPTPTATFGFMSPVPSLSAAQKSEALQCDQEGRKRQSRAKPRFMHMLAHSYS